MPNRAIAQLHHQFEKTAAQGSGSLCAQLVHRSSHLAQILRWFRLCIPQCFPFRCTRQQRTRKQFSAVIKVFSHASLTVTFFHFPFLAEATRLFICWVSFGISPGPGGVSSTLA